MADIDGEGRLEPGSSCRKTRNEPRRSEDMSGRDLHGGHKSMPTLGTGGGRIDIIVGIQDSARLFHVPQAEKQADADLPRRVIASYKCLSD